MSTRLHAYQFPKDRLWDFCDAVTEFCKKDHIINLEFIKQMKVDKEAYDKLDNLKDLIDIELQLFDVGPDWVVRILAYGYLVENKFVVPDFVQEKHVDTRSEDTPPEFEEVCETVDQLIRNNRYLTKHIWNKEIIRQIRSDMLFDQMMENYEKTGTLE